MLGEEADRRGSCTTTGAVGSCPGAPLPSAKGAHGPLCPPPAPGDTEGVDLCPCQRRRRAGPFQPLLAASPAPGTQEIPIRALRAAGGTGPFAGATLLPRGTALLAPESGGCLLQGLVVHFWDSPFWPRAAGCPLWPPPFHPRALSSQDLLPPYRGTGPRSLRLDLVCSESSLMPAPIRTRKAPSLANLEGARRQVSPT